MSYQTSNLAQSSVAHKGVNCDHCYQNPILGIRYKCINCPDYDLCPSCEEILQTQCFHSLTHTFLKIRTPSSSSFSFIPVSFPSSPSSSITPLTIPSLITSINTFTFTLHASFGSGTICGPNIYKALLMVANGANGPTLSAFMAALSLSLPFSSANLLLQSLESTLFAPTPSTEILNAASIWHTPFLTPLPSWTNAMRTYYGASFGPLDPSHINQFIATHTKKRITTNYEWKDLQPPLALVTAFYFKASWKTPFPKHQTYTQNFHDFHGTPMRSRCRLMSRIDDILYYSDSDIQSCLLEYVSSSPDAPQWAAAIILPRKPGREAMAHVLQGLNASTWDSFRGASDFGSSTYLHLSLPAFALRTQVNLAPELEKPVMGLSAAFRDDADFTKLAMGGEGVKIRSVDHWTYLKVDEVGTEVAAVTVVGMLLGGVTQRRVPVVMRCDRPFLFVVFERKGGLVVAVSVVDSVGEAGSGIFGDGPY